MDDVRMMIERIRHNLDVLETLIKYHEEANERRERRTGSGESGVPVRSVTGWGYDDPSNRKV